MIDPKPFLKWIGGKSGLLSQLESHLPDPKIARGYRQPFMGGGTPFWQVYSNVRPAVLSDGNPRLVDTYLAVRDHVEELLYELNGIQPTYSADRYMSIREAINHGAGSLIERATRFIVINKWGFNGLWRVNSRGGCNVPFGKTGNGKAPMLCDPDNLRACSKALQGVDIRHEDFAATLDGAIPGEVVYLDPPYWPVSDTANFTGYTAGGFSYGIPNSDHDRLVTCLHSLTRRSVHWVLSNADLPETRAAYASWDIFTVSARRSVNSDPSKRGPVGELVVRPKLVALAGSHAA